MDCTNRNRDLFSALRQVQGKAFAGFLLAAFFTLAGCDNGGGGTPALMGGTFGNKSFSVNQSGRSVRMIASDTTIPVAGVLRDGDEVYELQGLLDTEDGNFALSCGSANEGFELTGKRGDGKAKLKNKATNGEWDIIEDAIVFTDVAVEGSPNVPPAASFPDAWWGMYDFSELVTSDNRNAVEFWATVNPGTDRYSFIMSLGPYHISIWPNLDITGNAGMSFTEVDIANHFVLEVTRNSATEYEVLMMSRLHENNQYFTAGGGVGTGIGTEVTIGGERYEELYRKVKITQNGNKLNTVFAGTSAAMNAVCFPTAAAARAATFSANPTDTQALTLVFEKYGSW